MKKLGLFVNFQYDEPMFHFYRKCILDAIAQRYKNPPKLDICALNIVTDGVHFKDGKPYVTYGLFESYFRTSIEYAINVNHCKVLAVAMYDINLHGLAEEAFSESDFDNENVRFVNAIDCAIAAAKKHKKWQRLALLGMNFTPNDTASCKRFEEAGYEIVKLFNYDEMEDLCLRAADFINNYTEPETADLDSLRHICGKVEAAAKLAKLDAIVVGAPELDAILTHGAVQIPRVNLMQEHISSIVNALLS